MLIVLSPAKDLDFTLPQGPAAAGLIATAPRFPAETAALLEVLGGVSADALAELMDLSPRLAELNVKRYAALRAEPGATEQLPALYAFNGRGLSRAGGADAGSRRGCPCESPPAHPVRALWAVAAL
jgi:cytoplasmic iron level regulating protein YaaA (DUF328/UPF0246 family)